MLESNKKVIRRFLSEYVVPQWKLVLFAMFCTLISGLCTVAIAKFVKPIIDDVFVSKNVTALKNLALCFFGISILHGMSDYSSFLTLSKLWQKVLANLQVRSFSHLMRADLAFFNCSMCGDLVSKLTNDINVLKNIITLTIADICNDLFIVLGIVIVIFLQDPYFSIVAILGFSLTVLPTLRIGKRVRHISSDTQKKVGDWVSFLMQSFQGIRLIKSYNMEQYQKAKAEQISKDIYLLSMKSAKAKAIIHPTMEVLIGIAVAIIIFIGGWLVVKGLRTPGTLLSFLTALIMVYKPVKNLARANSLIQEGAAAAKRIYDLLDVKPTILDSKSASELRLEKAEIVFKNVVFRYADSDKNVIEKFNLTIPSHKVTALVGHSGSGKSTLINLIARFYDIQRGEILIDGQDVRDVTLLSLRNSISLVSQEVTLFNDTIYNNIAFGNMHASETEIINAAKLAAAYDFINEFSEKFQTEVGDNGNLLSGGQRQRISIARAILKNAPILLLDEATSALDSDSEKQIQNALFELMRNKTTIVIAHRLSTVLNADNIVVLDHGKILEQGTHEQLLQLNNHYARLYKVQQFS